MRIQYPFARSLVTVRKWPFFIDLGVALCALALFFAIVHTGEYWFGKPVPMVPISLKSSSLPLYAFYSVLRIGIAYVLSLVFAIAYGYIAAYNKRLEPWMIAALDILQSIPVLSFLPPVLLAMIALIPTHQLGIELGVIFLIFTGQVWNLAFSFYSSLKSIPREMVEASRIYRYSALQRFWQLEMPYAAIGLVWNSIISVANGWFALMACEMFQLKEASFQLPGLGSYINNATYEGKTGAQVAGILTVVLIVVATDQLLWRPLIAWSEKFKFEQVESADRVTSPVLELLKRSTLISSLSARVVAGIGEPIYRRLSKTADEAAGR
jgi:NitT/TauT family transport system permease protein